MDGTLERIGQLGVVPVVVIEEPADAASLVAALAAGGLPIAEITFRTAAAVEAIAGATEAVPDALIGAGSVLLPEQVDAAAAAGARFIVSPGIERSVVERAREHGLMALPGCATASELMLARQLALDVVKFFPAGPMGGLPMLHAVAAPFPGMRFVPTGGISQATLEEYLADPRVLAVGGSWMVTAKTVGARDWAAVTAAARAATAAVKRAHGGQP